MKKIYQTPELEIVLLSSSEPIASDVEENSSLDVELWE